MNTLHAKDATDILVDNYGKEYSVIRMPGNGFCGFCSLAYCLTGNQFLYKEIIDDIISVFTNIPELFRLRTNFGGRNDSSLTIAHYASVMQSAIQKVNTGMSIHSDCWAEDGHLAAISLLYDIAVFTYSTVNGQWHVFNESGSRYVCLLSTGNQHFDVLIGEPPHNANTNCVKRNDFDVSDDVWQCLQRNYTFQFVFKFPQQFTGVNILNSPVVTFNETECVTVADDRVPVKSKKTVYTCDVPGCSYTGNKSKSLSMHKMRVHKKKTIDACDFTGCSSNANDRQLITMHKVRCYGEQSCTNSNASLYFCDFPDCHYSDSRVSAVTMHKNKRRHHLQNASVRNKLQNSSVRQSDTQPVGKNCIEVNNAHGETVGIARNCRQHCTYEIDTDDNSVASVDSVTSRRSEIIAEKSMRCNGESFQKCKSKKGRYQCDVIDCGSTYDTARRLAVHKAKIHDKNVNTKDNNRNVNRDNISKSSVHDDSCTFRRSTRILVRKRKLNTPVSQLPLKQMKQVKTQTTTHTTKIAVSGEKSSEKSAEDIRPGVLEEVIDNEDDNIWCRSSLPDGTKQHLKNTFSRNVNKLEKKFLPRTKVTQHTDALYDKLKVYHNNLQKSVTNTTTEKLTSEVLDVIINPRLIDNCNRKFCWSKEDEARLNELNKTCKLLKPRLDWTWGAADDTEQGQYNDKRMQLCVTKECEWKLIECTMCGSTGILVGDQTDSEVCHDCLKLKRINKKEQQKKQESWDKVRPVQKDFPKADDGQDLPYLQPGDKAVIAPVQAVVTVKKISYANKKLRQESISLVQDPVPTWCKILPRTSLADRYMIIERRVRDCGKYIVANAKRVAQWLNYLFQHHKEFVRLKQQNELTMNETAIDALGETVELAEVDRGLVEHTTSEAQTIEQEIEQEDDGLIDATMTSGFSETHVFSFDRYPELYLKTKDVLRIRKEGKMEIIKDNTVRKPTYGASANLAFPHLYTHGEMSPLDFQDHKLGRYLLKKQALFAHRMGDGRLQWNYAEDDIHMAHQYSRLSEQTVRATVGYYISSHPNVAHVPLNNILTAFRDGVDKDSGLLDSHLPDLTTVMSQLPNSRQKWFSERLGIEAISRDVGSPNVFVTINLDPRASPDVRRLIYKLEHDKDMDREEPFMKDTAEFTRLINKYAPQIAIYLYRKVKVMMHVFFTKICGIPEKESKADWTKQDMTDASWYWGRVEFTETRGVQHWHFLVKLPHVLDTGLLGRIIHNGRVVRQEMKCGNIKPEKREEAWQMIEMGLLASRYAVLFAHSISSASFYSEDVDVDDHDDKKVINLEKYRKHYAKNYKEGNINLKTHPIMRRFDDPECHQNKFHEMADIASVSCLHQCIRGSCGGDPLTGDGCRFDFPKKELKYTVPAVMQVNANQMEARVLLRRSCNRVANLNRYLIRYLRSNHDVSVLIDSAHKLRYATKYCAKSGKHGQLLDEMIEHLNKRSTDLLPPNMKQVLSHLLLADCSHRAFISKQELAYKVMNLPDVIKSFSNVDIVGFYKRANLHVPYDDEFTIEYSDRTEYSAYAERCRDDTDLGRGLSKEAVQNMCLNEFSQTVQQKWVKNKTVKSKVIDETTKRKFRTRDVNSGHWRLTLYNKRKHTRPSTVLHTAPAIDYEFAEHGKTTSQTTFFDLPIEKRHQLYRSYYELVMYLPWKNTPDESFLSCEVQEILNDEVSHSEIDSRQSLQRLEEFFKVYRRLYDDGMVAPPGSAWQRDNQFSYSMYLVNQHNRDIHLDRVDNKGVLKAQYEDVDELVNVDVDIRPTVDDVTDQYEYPTFENFMPPDIFRDIVEQKALEMSEICVAFPLHYQWQHLEEVATHNKAKRFIANPPESPVDYNDMTPIQQFAVDMGKNTKQKILFLCGKAGSGKTAVALKICEHFRGRVQATAYTGKAASLFNGPTIHSMFGWSHNEHKSTTVEIKPDNKKVQDFRISHEDVDLFVFEEALAIPPAYFALIDEIMTAAFNPKHVKNSRGELEPFGRKKVLFLGDQAQLPPIGGPAVYDDSRAPSDAQNMRRESKMSKRTKTGQLIFEKHLVSNCIYLQQGQRNSGLLGEICDRMRQGKLTENDRTMLTHQRTRFPDFCTDKGIHYQNEMCSMNNWRQLWNECKQSVPQRRMFICKATYHMTEDNQNVVDALSALPPQAYDYAPDILCVAEGCEVRLLLNINTAAGLVTSQSGTVVKVIYNNADTKILLDGEHAVPYCVVVSFPAFQGFVEKRNGIERRIFPFPNHRTWVPVFRKRFSVKINYLPKWARKKQLEKDCFRIQFPLDLATNVTAHRAQGQTMCNCVVSVDLGLENPDTRLPPEMTSILYVACTRVTKLENLFLSAIHPCIWQKIGQSDVDKYRRTVDERLQNAFSEFATNHGMYQQMLDELAWTPDYSTNAEEWRQLKDQSEPPKSNRLHERSLPQFGNTDFHVVLGDCQFSMFSKPVQSERHIGIDQGVKNFAIAVVERTIGQNPKIVEAYNYTDLELKKRFKTSDVLVALSDKTNLMAWMNPVNGDYKVDRVILHLEQIDPRNKNSKQFAVDLGKLLQQKTKDIETCVVKMSQPHIHRATGPLFHLGDEIIETLQLQPALYLQRRSRAESNPSLVADQRTDIESEPSDVEPSDEAAVNRQTKLESRQYRTKKKMSSDVFRYIVEADDNQLQQMKLSVDKNVQNYWREKIVSDSSVKLDDVGDALLHALDELLCGSSNFKQLVPAAPAVQINRTVTIAVYPDTTYWIVLNCRWNTFVFENFGCFSSNLRNCYYKSPSCIDVIKANMLSCVDVWSSLSDFEGTSTYEAVDHVKVVVKQLTGHTDLALTNEQAGALTHSTTKAMKLICDSVIGVNSKLCDRQDRILGSMYSRTSTVGHCNRKFQIVHSTGKHTNAVLSCLSWMQQNLRDFVINRRQTLTEHEKKLFFHALLNTARSVENSMEMLQLSSQVKTKLCSNDVAVLMANDKSFTRNISDLVLVGISKNQQHVKAIAVNSRKTSRVTRLASSSVHEDVEP